MIQYHIGIFFYVKGMGLVLKFVQHLHDKPNQINTTLSFIGLFLNRLKTTVVILNS